VADEVRRIPGGTLTNDGNDNLLFTTTDGRSERLTGVSEFLRSAWEMAGMIEEFRELHDGVWVD
jgi:hypothetical protein